MRAEHLCPALRIAIDFDGTIADTNDVKTEWIKRTLGVEVPAWKCDRSRCVPIIGLERYEEMAEVAYGDEGTRTAKPVEGAVEAIKSLASQATLYVVTSRGASHLPAARDWLTSHGVIDLIRAVLSSAGRTKGEVCLEHGIGVLLDDDLRHVGPVEKGSPRAVLFARGPQDSTALDAIHVGSWPEFVRWVERLAHGMPAEIGFR